MGKEMNLKTQAVERFGEVIVGDVRSVSIQQCHLPLMPHRMTRSAVRWRAAASSEEGITPAKLVIPETVDVTIFEMLRHTDDQEMLHLLFRTSRGELVDLLVEGGGELGGWYIGTGEWRPRYSKERFIDDFADVPSEWGVHDGEDVPALNLDELSVRGRAIEELGILLVRHVRDVAIQSCDLQLLPHSETAMAKRWRKAALPFNGKVPPEILIPDCVDETIFTFLRAIDQGLLPLSFTAENGETIDLTKVGNLAERYIKPGGWRDQFSNERVNQD